MRNIQWSRVVTRGRNAEPTPDLEHFQPHLLNQVATMTSYCIPFGAESLRHVVAMRSPPDLAGPSQERVGVDLEMPQETRRCRTRR